MVDKDACNRFNIDLFTSGKLDLIFLLSTRAFIQNFKIKYRRVSPYHPEKIFLVFNIMPQYEFDLYAVLYQIFMQCSQLLIKMQFAIF